MSSLSPFWSHLQVDLVPSMALASADSNGSFAQERLPHQDHAWSSASGKPGSSGQLSRGRVVNGSVMEVFSCPRVLAREAAAHRAALERRCQRQKLSGVALWDGRGEGERSGFAGARALRCTVL